MRVFLPADVRCNCPFEPCSTNLLEDCRAGNGIVQRRGAGRNQGIFVSALEAGLVRV